MASKISYFLRYSVDDEPVIERCRGQSYGAAVAEALVILRDARKGVRFVAIFDVDPRVQPGAEPIATRFG
jgi:hypothetical protein